MDHESWPHDKTWKPQISATAGQRQADTGEAGPPEGFPEDQNAMPGWPSGVFSRIPEKHEAPRTFVAGHYHYSATHRLPFTTGWLIHKDHIKGIPIPPSEPPVSMVRSLLQKWLPRAHRLTSLIGLHPPSGVPRPDDVPMFRANAPDPASTGFRSGKGKDDGVGPTVVSRRAGWYKGDPLAIVGFIQ